jgi:hypothetical protein
MLPSVHAFVERLIDYAGMFPPARLSLHEALRHYTRLAAAPEAWMLGRFVCAAARLGDLLDYIEADSPALRLPVTALGRGGQEMEDLASNLQADLRDIAGFRGESGSVDVIELSLPSMLSDDDLERLTELVIPELAAAGLRAFFEVPLSPDWEDEVIDVSDALAANVPSETSALRAAGIKIRCGGATSAAVPAVEQLAFFIDRCRETGLPWKATAGLHHPLRHYDPALQTMAHGFINVFAGGILSRTHGLSQNQLAEVLTAESIDPFRFAEDRFGWREWDCTLEEIRSARDWLPSFGSCSFDEPRDDLRALGLIDGGPKSKNE